jgi:hypothetical protein
MARVGSGGGVAVGFRGEGKNRGTRFGRRLALVLLAGGPREEKRRTHTLSVACLGRHILTPIWTANGSPRTAQSICVGLLSLVAGVLVPVQTQRVTRGPFASGRWRCPKDCIWGTFCGLELWWLPCLPGLRICGCSIDCKFRVKAVGNYF